MVLNRLNLSDPDVPVIVAPMAGGPSTPELAAAATNASGLGFIAAGLLPADVFAERVIAARKLTSGPLGVNLLVPQPSAGTPSATRTRRADARRRFPASTAYRTA
jgi:nitronate monooxygenase